MSKTQRDSGRTANRRTVTKLLLVVVGMFGFGFALVPLYSVICTVTGLNGKTSNQPAAVSGPMQVDDTRWVNVEFMTSVDAGLPWAFKAEDRSLRIHPGAMTTALFLASNRSEKDIVGRAVPSVAPGEAARYFNKTECFCFTQQTLSAGETKEMPVRFFVSPDLPRDVRTITLSYTFYEVEEETEKLAHRATANGVDGNTHFN